MPCSRAPQLWVSRVEESAVLLLPPPTIPTSTETRTIGTIGLQVWLTWVVKCMKYLLLLLLLNHTFFLFSLQIYNINRILKKILSNICTISIEGALQILPSHTSIRSEKYSRLKELRSRTKYVIAHLSDLEFKYHLVKVPTITFSQLFNKWDFIQGNQLWLEMWKINLPLNCLVTVSLIIIFIHLLWCFYPFIPHHSLYFLLYFFSHKA